MTTLVITTWSEAKDNGQKLYCPGKPCKKGHVGERYVSSSQCVQCVTTGTGGPGPCAAAKKKGLSRYFTGQPCKNGHVCERYTCNSGCVKCGLVKNKKWRRDNLERARERERAWYYNNPEKVAAKYRARLLRNTGNPEHQKKTRAYRRVWREENRETVRTYARRWSRHKRREDINYRISGALRHRLWMAIKNESKTGSAVRDLGCTIPELKEHLEAQFQPGMSWESWTTDGWHLDHVIPLASFDLTDRAQLKKACHYTNLQPLWAADNLSKGAKVA